MLGEVSPTFWGRTDAEGYTQACEKLLNCLVRPIGGAYKRRGTRLVTPSLVDAAYPDLQDLVANGEVKLINFKQYVIVVGKNGSTRVLGYMSPHDSTLTYTFTAIAAFSGSAGTYGTDADLNIGSIKYASYGDFLVIVDGFSNPLLVVDDGGTLKYVVWGFGELATSLANGLKTLDTDEQHRIFPYINENVSAVTITPSATTGTITLTASASTFVSTMVKSGAKHGVHVRVRSGSTVGVAEITAFTSATVVTAVVKRTMPGTAAYTAWAFSHFNRYFGFPTDVAFYEERMWFCGAVSGVVTTFADYIFASQSGDLFELAPNDPSTTVVNTDAYNLPATPNVSTGAEFLEVMSGRLFVGLGEQVTYLVQTDSTDGLGALNTTIKSANAVGAGKVQPVVVDNSIIYPDYAGHLREVVYNFEEDSFRSLDLNSLTEDIYINRALEDYGRTYSGILTLGDLFYSLNLKTIFGRDRFGSLFSLTRSRTDNISAWAHHRLGGSLDTYDGVQVLAMCITNYLGDEKITFCCRRSLNGVEYTTLEIMDVVPHQRTLSLFDADYITNISGGAEAFDNPSNIPVYMDCAITSFATTGGGEIDLDSPFDGVALSVMADGQYLGEVTPGALGVIALADLDPADYSHIFFGLIFTTDIVPIALQSNSLFGSGIAQIKRTEEVAILFSRTAQAEFGELEQADDLQEIQFRESSVPSGDPTPLFTGEKIFKLRANYRNRQNILIRSSKPYPMEVTCVVAKGILYD